MPVPAVNPPEVNTGFKDGRAPVSFELASPLTGVFSIVVVASATATGRLPTIMVIVVLLHTIGLTAVLHTVYVVVIDPVYVGFGVKV